MSAPWSSSTGSTWENGVIAGTGVIGAVVFGSAARVRAVFSHERFFVPANSRKPAPHLAPVISSIRAALAEGDERLAADTIDARLRELGWDSSELIWTDPLGPLAQLVWSTDGPKAREYRRNLDPENLGADVSWSTGDGWAGFRLHANHGDEHMDLEVWSDFGMTGTLSLNEIVEQRPTADHVPSINYAKDVTTVIRVDRSEMSAVVTTGAHESASPIHGSLTVIAPTPMKIDDGGWKISIEPGASIWLKVRANTTAPGPDAIGSVPSGQARSTLRLVDGAYSGEIEPLWESARQGNRTAESEVLEVAYGAACRNILASTGALPPNLQGVWQGTWTPAWSADYTLNGNVQLGTLAGVLWTGNPQLMKSLFRLVMQFPEHYRNNARTIFGAEGMHLPARMTTHGHANHFLREYPHEFWIGNGPWILRMADDYMSVTGDESIIDEWLWEYTQEIIRFSLDVLEQGGGDLSPSYSPENTPIGRDNPLATNATADLAALRDALRIGSRIARLKGQVALAEQWEDARSAIKPYRVSPDGTLAEWGEGWAENIAHRHASHLHGLWYEQDEDFNDPVLRLAALASVRAKIAWRAEAPYAPPGHMEMAFGLSSIGLAAAALGDSESAYQCALWLARDHFTPGLVTTHDAGRIFNLDASGALPAVIAAMLLTTTNSEVVLFPARPLQWSEGAISHLTGRGGVRVHHLSWNEDEISCELELAHTAAWLRPPVTRITMPAAGSLVEGSRARQVGDTTLELDSDVGQTSFTFQLTKQNQTEGRE